jgi:hypothetical protein
MAFILVILSLPQIAASARAALVTAIVLLGLVVMAVETAVPSLYREQEQSASVVFSHSGNTARRCEAWYRGRRGEELTSA